MSCKTLQLNNSGVQFNEAAHQYFLDGKELSGITSVLHRQLFEDKYSDIPKSVLDRAAEYGSGVHATIELCDSLGDTGNTDENYVAYRRLMQEKGLTTVRNEYIVTDREHYASAIDITAVDSEGNIALIDIKTTSKLDKEYVSWQLSIYRHLFYLQNPELKGKVKTLCAVWLPKKQYGNPAIVEVEPKDESTVVKLLDADSKGERFMCDNPVESDGSMQLSDDAISEAVEICKELADAKQREADLKNGLLEIMRLHNVKSFKDERILLTRVIPSSEESFTFDSARLKEEMPEIYNKFLKKRAKQAESIKIKIY